MSSPSSLNLLTSLNENYICSVETLFLDILTSFVGVDLQVSFKDTEYQMATCVLM
jgi:hypothetical protein